MLPDLLTVTDAPACVFSVNEILSWWWWRSSLAPVWLSLSFGLTCCPPASVIWAEPITIGLVGCLGLRCLVFGGTVRVIVATQDSPFGQLTVSGSVIA